ncbi:hypothetical protein ACQP2F_06025 [Actinoplanes sp. CA-030573]|uniref:hypothetical protein n=1 Tax=Actinoplanes sp. CA-030573 TaxID=3239898 RepID=UPI003D8D5E03
MSAYDPALTRDGLGVRLVKSAFALFAGFLAVVVLSSGFLRGVPHWQGRELFARVAAGLAAAVITVGLFRCRRDRLSAEDCVHPGLAIPRDTWLDDLSAEAARRIRFQTPKSPTNPAGDPVPDDFREAVAVFVELIMNPAKHRVRVAETIDLEGSLMVQRVTVELALPPGWDRAKFLYLPVLHPVKGELVDNLRLRDAGDCTLADLTYDETTRLAAAGLRFLLAMGYEKVLARADPAATEQWPDEDTRKSETELLRLLAIRGYADLAFRKAEMERQLDDLPLDDLAQDRLRRYVLELCGAYPIVAVVPPAAVTGGRVLLKYERTLTASSRAAPDGHGRNTFPQRVHRGIRGWRGLTRIALGLRPSQIAVPIDLALTASSYHLTLNAPESKYVLEQRLVCIHCKRPVQSSWIGSDPSRRGCCHRWGEEPPSMWFDDRHYFRLQRRRGQNFIHLYLRGFGAMSPKMDGLRIVGRFKEVPPGSRLQAVMTALATTVLLTVVGYLVSHHRVSPGSDYPAVVLGLPAVVASWFGIATDRNALVGGSLLARVSLIVSGVLSIVSIVTYLVTAPTSGSGGHAAHPHVTFLGVTQPAWIALGVVSFLNFLYVYYRFLLKLVHYRDLLGRTHGHWSAVQAN